jgi:hypothetical protein
MADGVLLNNEAKSARKRAGGAFTWKKALLMFVAFLLVVSDYFTNNVLVLFSGTSRGREVTNAGAGVQAVFLILIYAVGTHLIDENII